MHSGTTHQTSHSSGDNGEELHPSCSRVSFCVPNFAVHRTVHGREFLIGTANSGLLHSSLLTEIAPIFCDRKSSIKLRHSDRMRSRWLASSNVRPSGLFRHANQDDGLRAAQFLHPSTCATSVVCGRNVEHAASYVYPNPGAAAHPKPLPAYPWSWVHGDVHDYEQVCNAPRFVIWTRPITYPAVCLLRHRCFLPWSHTARPELLVQPR